MNKSTKLTDRELEIIKSLLYRTEAVNLAVLTLEQEQTSYQLELREILHKLDRMTN
jgi:hypothetical protein